MGNKLPWILAGVFGAFVVAVIVKFVAFPAPTGPVATAPLAMLALRQPEEPLSLVIGSEPSGAGNAGNDYKLAMDAYQDNKWDIKKILERAQGIARKEYRYTPEELGVLKNVADHVAAGAGKEKMSLCSADEIRMPYYPFKADQYEQLMDILDILALHYRMAEDEKGYAQAEKCYFDMLVMGRHMVDERGRFLIVYRGVGVQEIACDGLVGLYGRWQKPDKLKNAKVYRNGLLALGNQYSDLQKVLRRGSPHPGDIFNLVANHADPAVRVEAIIRLGQVRHSLLGRGDQRRLRQLIEAKLASDDEMEQAAARAADTMTADDVRALGREETVGRAKLR